MLLPIALALHALPLWQRVEWLWLDARFRVLRAVAPLPAAETIAIVGIDEGSLRRFGLPVATLHAQLGRALEAVGAAGPRAMGLDIALPAMSYDRLQPGLDAALARGLLVARRSAPLVVGVALDPSGQPRALHAPFAAIAGAQGLGFTAVPVDGDGVVRRFEERLGEDETELPTLAGQIGRALGLQPTPGLVQFALGEPFTFVPIGEVDAWAQTGAQTRLREAFGGKVVLFGSALPFDDQHRVPVQLSAWSADSATVHGVLIHAQYLRSMLAGAQVRSLPAWLTLPLLAIACLAWLWAPNRKTWLAAGASSVAVLGASVIGLRLGWDFPAVALALAPPAALGARNARDAWIATLERRRLREAFGGMVSPHVLDEILAGRLAPDLGGETREVCILFSDIRGFTSISESLRPDAVVAMLNTYFDRMTRAIHRHQGMLDKFMGDGIMAVFGAPNALASPCACAFAAAKDMIAELAGFNAERAQRGEAPLAIGIGLHFGAAVVGFVGSSERYEYSAIGDAVNTASRIEGLTKETGCPLVMSRDVAARLDVAGELAALGVQQVKGRAPVEVFGWRPRPAQEAYESCEGS